ncbi:MAG: DUF4105 domain-containing protein [Alphaproteobacteria bacterium]|nr:DUF4105 domain-containing protein [Alphaproteobacteria bacterium]
MGCSNAFAETPQQRLIRIANEKKLYESQVWLELLHYDGKESVVNRHSPFFLDRTSGYKNPKAEMFATIEAFFFKDRYDEEHAICMFPARFDYLLKNTGFSEKDLPKQYCRGYLEFKQKVPMDTVSIVFASENNMVPTSVMGHLFLKFEGKTADGKLREHAFSYFAIDAETTSPQFYYDVLVSSVDGMYILSPYVSKKSQYLYKEQRSIWEINLQMSEAQKDFLHKHVWELKEKLVGYSFVFHNCGTALVNLLKVPYDDLSFKQRKPFETPIDYVLYLQEQDKISQVVFVPSPEYELKMIRNNYSLTAFYQANQYIANGKEAELSPQEQYLTDVLLNYKLSKKKIDEETHTALYKEKILPKDIVQTHKEILQSKPSSKIYVGYKNYNKDAFVLKYMPVYQEISDVSPAQFDDYETKIFALDMVYDGKSYLNKLDLVQMRSIVDASVANDIFSKYAKVSFENALGERGFKVKPVLEAGAGLAYSFFNNKLKPYVLPKIGYRYDKINNFYISPEIGIIFKPKEEMKIIVSYDRFFNSKQNNRGYNEDFKVSATYDLSKRVDFNLTYHKYSGTTSKENDEVLLGLGYYF